MKELVTIFLSAIVAIACHADAPERASDTATLTQGLWVHLDSQWERYGEENMAAEVAYARVLQFARDGEFSWIACMLLRNEKQKWVSISAGDGQVIFMGRWRVVRDAIEARYVKTYEMVRRIDGGDPPFGKVHASIVRVAADELTFDGRKYSRANAPDMKNYEQYIGPERKTHGDRLHTYFPP